MRDIHLSPRQAEIVTLVGRDGLSYAEVADSLGISHHTVRSHVRRLSDQGCFDRSPREALVDLYHRVVSGGDTVDGVARGSELPAT